MYQKQSHGHLGGACLITTESDTKIRSGYASDFEKRFQQHRITAEKLNPDSKFYTLYPSITRRDRETSPDRVGWAEHLKYYIAYAAEKDAKGTPIIPALFDSCPSRISGKPDEKGQLVGYLFELAFDLCLAKRDRVSESFGFERYLQRNDKYQ